MSLIITSFLLALCFIGVFCLIEAVFVFFIVSVVDGNKYAIPIGIITAFLIVWLMVYANLARN